MQREPLANVHMCTGAEAVKGWRGMESAGLVGGRMSMPRTGMVEDI